MTFHFHFPDVTPDLEQIRDSLASIMNQPNAHVTIHVPKTDKHGTPHQSRQDATERALATFHHQTNGIVREAKRRSNHEGPRAKIKRKEKEGHHARKWAARNKHRHA